MSKFWKLPKFWHRSSGDLNDVLIDPAEDWSLSRWSRDHFRSRELTFDGFPRLNFEIAASGRPRIQIQNFRIFKFLRSRPLVKVCCRECFFASNGSNRYVYIYIYTSVDPCITCTAIEIIVIIMIIISIIIIIMIINMLIINISNINFIHGCITIGVNNMYLLIIMALPL